MARSNVQRIGDALQILSKGLGPFVDRECQSAIGDDWVERFIAGQAAKRGAPKRHESPTDVQFLLKAMWEGWNQIFGKVLSRADRTLVSELIDVRNKWAHQEPSTIDDTYRALDSMHRLLQSVSAGDAATLIDQAKQEVLRLSYEEKARKRSKKAADGGEGREVKGLKPWREVVTPHPDVASGRYQQAEFAADLAQVHRGEGSSEYLDPGEFFRRTFLTEGIKQLLVEAVRRLSGSGGDPVVQLQTNFGGGKTHSLLALYHLFSGAKAADLPGIEGVIAEAGVSAPDQVARAVLVGTDLSPGQPRVKENGIEVRTLWGELAWQIGGAEAYELVAKADRTATNPGDALGQIFTKWGPCLVLIDEWVAYARQLYGKSDLPAGTFDTHFTFAQALTEKARAAGNTLVVISIPASESLKKGERVAEIEVGGEGGIAALERLRNVIGRLESPWQPATTEESFEIVRRRLFQDLSKDGHDQRDAVAKAFVKFYSSQAHEFPSECKEAAYERRIKAAYPIHPELFDRLYTDWSSLERFQRTRGVLRLMAAFIHALWERGDPSPLIMPGTVPIEDMGVLPELTRYLEDNWKPVIESDVDGPNSLPKILDQENPNLGRFHACRRVARTIYLGSAPKTKGAHKGIDERQVRLGAVLPGETTAVFGDALRRLSDRSSYLLIEGQSYAYSPNPSLLSLAKDRAEQRRDDEVVEEIRARLARDGRKRGPFSAVHAAPVSPSDVPDEAEARLVVLSPDQPHSSKTEHSAALEFAKQLLDERGGGARRYRNMLVFASADSDLLADLKQSARQYLAWAGIVDDAEELNLDPGQLKQAKDRMKNADGVVDQRLNETYQWLLVPSQKKEDQGKVDWEIHKVSGQDPLAERAGKRLVQQEGLITEFGGIRLRFELDRIPLWRGNHVGLAQLWEDFAQYLYLPRLRDSSVLAGAIQDGVALTTWTSETFAYSSMYEEESGQYRGVKAGEHPSVIIDSTSVLLKPDVAARQLEKVEPRPLSIPEEEKEAGRPGVYRRFYGSVSLDPLRASRDLAQIIESIVSHLNAIRGADVELTLEINVEISDGAPEDVRRTVTENANTLKFKTHGFEKD
jgi:predicted AAA+ superfamily ATPase